MSDLGSAMRRWLDTLPGLFKSDVSRHDVLAQAWASSSIQCSLTDFEEELARCGYEPRQIRTFRHTLWHLQLPSTGQARYG